MAQRTLVSARTLPFSLNIHIYWIRELHFILKFMMWVLEHPPKHRQIWLYIRCYSILFRLVAEKKHIRSFLNLVDSLIKILNIFGITKCLCDYLRCDIYVKSKPKMCLPLLDLLCCWFLSAATFSPQSILRYEIGQHIKNFNPSIFAGISIIFGLYSEKK